MRLFATKVLQFIRDGAAGHKPTHLAIIFDKTENSFRRDIYPQYKAHRKDPPDELVPQFPLMRATVSAFGMVPIEQSRYEADDIIATYARQAREAGADVLIVSADKDLMQLVEPGVSMYDPASGQAGVAGSREERRFGPDEVKEYFGVGPDRVVDVQALAGDSTDNVPGAPGIGLKTAAQLITEYGDLETLLARAGEIKQPKRREALTNPDTVKLIRVSKQLVTLDRDVPVETPLEVARDAGARRQAADLVFQGDGAHDAHPSRRRDLRRRHGLDRAGPALRRPRGLAGRPGRSPFGARRRRAGGRRVARCGGPCARAARAESRATRHGAD